MRVLSVKASAFAVSIPDTFSTTFFKEKIMRFNFKNKVSQAFLAAGVMVASAVPAHAAGEFDAFIDAVDLSGIAAKVIAAGLLVIGVAIAFKGPDLAKRIVRKV